MMWQRVIPLFILLIIALLVVVLVLWKRRDAKEDVAKARNIAEAEWDGQCQFDNPETGAVCERKEFHLENHYHDVNGKLVYW